MLAQNRVEKKMGKTTEKYDFVPLQSNTVRVLTTNGFQQWKKTAM